MTASSTTIAHDGGLRVSCSAAVSMAVLQVNSDQRGLDLIGQFLPFVVEVLREQTGSGMAQAIDMPTLQAGITETFSLQIPSGALKTLLNRAKDKGYVIRKNGCFYPVPEKLDTSTLLSTRATVLREHEALISAFRAHALSVLEVEVSDVEAAQALDAYLTRAMVPLLSSVVEGATLHASEDTKLPVVDLAIEAFIVHVAQSDPTLFGYVGNIVKGSMLASALYFPDLGRASAAFQGTAFYLDTRLLLHALGHAGEPAREAATEFLTLLRESNGRLYAFEHTVREVEGVLEAAHVLIADPRRHRSADGETVLFFLDAGVTASDVVRYISEVRRGLDKLSVVVKPTPPFEEGLGIDEIGLEDRLQTAQKEARPQAVRNDVASLAAVHRLRRGVSSRRLEAEKAVFVTTNLTLVNTARRELTDTYPWGTIPLAMVAHDLAALAWVKKPGIAPNLPTKILVADCYAALNPRDDTWLAYLKRIRDLRSDAAITDEGYMLLRADLQVRALLQIRQLEEGTPYADGDLVELARKAEQHIGMELRAELEAKAEETERERSLRESAELEIERLTSALDSRDAEKLDAMHAANERHLERLDKLAGRSASAAVTMAVIALGTLALIGTLATFPATESWFAHFPKLARQTVGGLSVLLLLAGVFDLLGAGPSLLWPRIRAVAYRSVRRVFTGLFPPPHPELEP